ncbi:MAG TPA: hypothetical protein VJS89_08820 [Gammaproteobacteria bacterium]|nr:hypothetical protein [Gammaproteobacteria bacterium]
MKALTLICVLLSSCVIFLAGCEAMLVPYTSNPRTKLADAIVLIQDQNRPLPAERLIRDAINTYKNEHDEFGLAQAYKMYGFFFRSPTVTSWEKFYTAHGFLDKTATWQERYQKSIQYYEMANEIFASHQQYDWMSNVDMKLAVVYLDLNNKDAACQEYDRALYDSNRYKALHPDATFQLPTGVSSMEQFVSQEKAKAGC